MESILQDINKRISGKWGIFGIYKESIEVDIVAKDEGVLSLDKEKRIIELRDKFIDNLYDILKEP